jgi:hemerythrin-like domain-containing protein
VNEETDEGPALLKENLAEYKTMKNLIQQLRDTAPHSRGVYKFRELLQNVDYHVAEEDTDLFPLVEEELEKDMQDLRHKMQELKAQILAS